MAHPLDQLLTLRDLHKGYGNSEVAQWLLFSLRKSPIRLRSSAI
jgi:hypothetical protein